MSNIQIVDREDSLIDTKPLEKIDFDKDIYRITTLWVVDGNGRTLITKRDVPMIDENDTWAPSVIGTVVDRETYRTNPLNEVSNQLGIDEAQLRAGPKELFEGERTYFCRWYLVEIDEAIEHFDTLDELISDIKWIDIEKLSKDVADNPDNYVSTMAKSVETLKEMVAP